MRNSGMTWVGRLGVTAGAVLLGSTLVLAGEGEGKGKGKPLGGPRADKAAATQPAGGRFGGGRAMDGALHEMLGKLNLSAEQKTKVDKLVEEQKAIMKKWLDEHKGELEKARTALEAAQESKDEAKIREARKAMMELRSSGPGPKELADKIRAVLTPDQQKQFDEAIAKKREEMRKDGGPGMGKHRGEGKGERHGKGGAAPADKPKDGNKLNL